VLSSISALALEVGVVYQGQTQVTLYATISGGLDRGAAASSVYTGPLRGRDEELAAIAERLHAATDGTGSGVLLQGAAGSGKSRLLAEAASLAARTGVAAGRGFASPGGQMMSFVPLLSALFDPQSPLLDRSAVAELRSLADRPYWLLEELEARLEEEAMRRPLLVAVDDLQWADGATLAALPILIYRTADIPVVWVASSRLGDLPPVVASSFDQLRKMGAHRVELGTLSPSAVTEVIADVVGAEADPDLIAIANIACGNPFSLLEMLHGLIEEGLVEIAGGRARLVRASLPKRVRETMHDRLDRMSPLAGQVANVATAMGSTFTLTAIAAALGQPSMALLGPVDELTRANIMMASAGRLAFCHELVREAVLDQLPDSTRRPLLRQAASALLAEGASPIDVAPLLVASVESGDQIAVNLLTDAGRSVASSQPEMAADLYQRALACLGDRHPARAELIADTAVVLHAAGRVEDAKVFAARALHEALTPDQQAEIRLVIAGMLRLSPDVRSEASRTSVAQTGVSPVLRARHWGWLLLNLCYAGRLDAARVAATEAEETVRAAADPAASFALELGLAGMSHLSGDFAAAFDHLRAAEHDTTRAGMPELAFMTQTRRCDVLAVCDRLDEALDLATDRLAQARENQAAAVRCWDIYTGRYLLQAARLGDASAVLEGCLLAPAETATIVAVPEAAGLLALAQVALHTEDRVQARACRHLAQTTLATASAPEVRRHVAWLLALQALAKGDAKAAHGWVQPTLSDDGHSVLPLLTRDLCDYPQLVRIALDAGDIGLARETVCAIEDIRRRNPSVGSIEGSAAHASALLHADPAQLGEAVELLHASPRPLAYASALEDLGRLLLADHKEADAVDAYSKALKSYAVVGATWDTRRVRGRLRRLGVRRRLIAGTRPEHGWRSLTEAELFVVRRVANGLTNRDVAAELYVSPHTVSTHLRHAFRKLGVNSRVELTRLILAHDSQTA
jgi:DNA-binding CsgD family transcriptional regulator